MELTAVIVWLSVFYYLIPTSLFWPIVAIGFGLLWIHASTGMSLRRKTAISTWKDSSSASIFAKLSVDMTNALAYIEKYRNETGTKITITHLVGKAVGIALHQRGGLNGRLLLGKYIKNDTVDVCFLVATGGGSNLAPKTIRNIDKKSIEEICTELTTEAGKVRSGTDEEFKKNMDLVSKLPTFVLSLISEFIGFYSGDLGWGLSAIGLKPRNFGCCMITNVGMFGVEESFAPFTPFSRTPLLLLIGSVNNKPVVRDGEIVVRPMMKLNATMDHRFVDGADGAKVGLLVKELLENPEKLDQK